MLLPSLSHDFWQLLSAEERQAAFPETFEIPALNARKSLQPGDAAKLIFEIEGEEESGDVTSSTERMWVLVTHRLNQGYLGVLVNKPSSIAADEGFYLNEGSEVPFLPKHVCSIDKPPAAYVAEILGRVPTRLWQGLDESEIALASRRPL